MADVEALERALDYPWEKWTVFLHPAQRQLVEREYNGPARVSGSAGTGKTIVALHRAVHLARAHPESRVLLATFSDALAAALRTRLKRLIGNEPKIAERLEVHSMSGIGRRLYAAIVGRLDLAAEKDIRELLRQAAADVEGHRFGAHFLWTEWSTVVDAWQLASWADPRTSVSRSCGFWRPWAAADRTACSSPGDLGQRIFQTPFSWRALGVDVRGRSQ